MRRIAKADPGLLEDRKVVQDWIYRLSLNQDTWSKTVNTDLYDQATNGTEFERDAAFAKFKAFLSREATDAPLRVLRIRTGVVGSYDREKRAFPIDFGDRRAAFGDEMGLNWASWPSLAVMVSGWQPIELPMPEAEAAVFAKHIGPSRRITAAVQLLIDKLGEGTTSGKPWVSAAGSVESIKFYMPPKDRRSEFGEPILLAKSNAVGMAGQTAGPPNVYEPLLERNGWVISNLDSIPSSDRGQKSACALQNALLSFSVAKALRERPGQLPDEPTARLLMRQFLSGAQAKQLTQGVSLNNGLRAFDILNSTAGETAGSAIETIFEHLNQFDKIALIEKFTSTYLPIIADAAPRFPMSIVAYGPVILGEYDFKQGGFKDAVWPTSLGINGIGQPSVRLLTEETERQLRQLFVRLPIEIARQLGQNTRSKPAVAVFGTIGDIEFNLETRGRLGDKDTYAFGGYNPRIKTSVQRVSLFTDDTLKTELAHLALPSISQSTDQPAPHQTYRSLLAIRSTPSAVDGSFSKPVQNRPAAGRHSDAEQPKVVPPPSTLRLPLSTDSLIRIGGNTLMLTGTASSLDWTVLRAIAALQSRASGRNFDALDSSLRDNYPPALARQLAAMAYADWSSGHPDEPIPIPLIAHLMFLYSGEQSMGQVLDGLSNRSLQPFSIPMKPPYNPVLSTMVVRQFSKLEPQSEELLRTRFEQIYGQKVRKLAANRDVVVVRGLSTNDYDFQAKGFRLGAQVPTGTPAPGRKSKEEIIINAPAHCCDGHVMLDDWALPSLIPMPSNRARDLALRAGGSDAKIPLLDARIGRISRVDGTFISGSKAKFAVDVAVATRKLFVDSALQQLLLEVSRPESAETPDQQPTPPKPAGPPPAVVPAPEPRPATAPTVGQTSMAQSVPALHHQPAQPVQQPPPTTPQPAQRQAFRPDRVYDIVGLNLDMSAPEAARLLTDTMGFERVLSVAGNSGALVTAFGMGQVFVKDDNKEYIALLTQAERSGDRLVAIGRYVLDGMGINPKAELEDALREKYGLPREVSGAYMTWGGLGGTGRTDGPCHIQLGLMLNPTWTDASGRVPTWSEYIPSWAPPAFQGPKMMPWPGLKVNSFDRAKKFKICGPSVIAWLPEVGGQYPEFAIWLTDTGAYMDILLSKIIGEGKARPRL